MELKEFFTLCEEQTPSKRTELRRTSFALRRNGVATMEELCQLLSHSPEKIAELRDVGAKSLALIKEVCLLYDNMPS